MECINSEFTGVGKTHLITVNGGKADIHLYVAALLLNTEDTGLFCILKQGLFWAIYLPY